MPTRASVVNGPKEKMESPQNIVPGKMRQAAAKCLDKHATRLIETLGNQLFEQRGILRGENRSQADEI